MRAQSRHRNPEDHRKEQDRQDVVTRKGGENVFRDDVQHDLAEVLVPFPRCLISLEILLVLLGHLHPAAVDPRARPRHVRNHQPDRQRQRRHQLEVNDRLQPHSPGLAKVPNAGDPHHHRQEDDRRHHHLHQPDEPITQRL